MRDERDGSPRISVLGRVLESNERRLDALDRRGVQVSVDPRVVFEFLLDRALASTSARELRLSWLLNVAGVLKQVEAEAPGANGAMVDLTTRQEHGVAEPATAR